MLTSNYFVSKLLIIYKDTVSLKIISLENLIIAKMNIVNMRTLILLSLSNAFYDLAKIMDS